MSLLLFHDSGTPKWGLQQTGLREFATIRNNMQQFARTLRLHRCYVLCQERLSPFDAHPRGSSFQDPCFLMESGLFLDLILVDVSDIFNFFCSGEGRGSPSRQEEPETVFFLKIPGGGGFPGGGGGAGAKGCPRRIGEFGGGGGAKYFVFGAEMSTKL